MNKDINLKIITILIVLFILNSCGFFKDFENHQGALLISNGWTSNWTPWKDLDDKYNHGSTYGDYDDITYANEDGEYLFRFKINPGQTFYKKTKKWTVYSGIMEYYVNDSYPTINDIFLHFNSWYYIHDGIIEPFIRYKNGKVKRTAKATIKIAPYNKHPKIYYIYFDDVGFAFNLGSYYFPKSSWVKQFDKQKLQKSNYYKQQNEIYE